MSPEPQPQVLPAGRTPIHRRAPRADPRIQQDQASVLLALASIHQTGADAGTTIRTRHQPPGQGKDGLRPEAVNTAASDSGRQRVPRRPQRASSQPISQQAPTGDTESAAAHARRSTQRTMSGSGRPERPEPELRQPPLTPRRALSMTAPTTQRDTRSWWLNAHLDLARGEGPGVIA
jgi:hypothetical protein